MKLQKLVYYAYGWWALYHDEPIISEAPQVWRHGPVFYSLYHALKHHGRSPIRTLQCDVPFEAPPRVDDADTEAHQLIDFVWSKYGAYGSFTLSDMTHRPGSAWHSVALQHNWRVPQGTPIPGAVIKDEFKREAQALGFK